MYNEFSTYKNEIGTIRTMNSNGTNYIAGEDIANILEVYGADEVMASIPDKEKMIVTAYDRDPMTDRIIGKNKVTYITDYGMDTLISNCTNGKGFALKKYMLSKVYPDMFDTFLSDISDRDVDIMYIAEVFAALHKCQIEVREVNRKLDRSKEIFEDLLEDDTEYQLFEDELNLM